MMLMILGYRLKIIDIKFMYTDVIGILSATKSFVALTCSKD